MMNGRDKGRNHHDIYLQYQIQGASEKPVAAMIICPTLDKALAMALDLAAEKGGALVQVQLRQGDQILYEGLEAIREASQNPA